MCFIIQYNMDILTLKVLYRRAYWLNDFVLVLFMCWLPKQRMIIDDVSFPLFDAITLGDNFVIIWSWNSKAVYSGEKEGKYLMCNTVHNRYELRTAYPDVKA